MAITSGFFNSKNGDRKYNAEHISKYFDKLITSGVFPNPSTNLQVASNDGMTLQVLGGRGIFDCHWINNDGNYILTVGASDVVLNRIDVVIVKLDLTENVRGISIEIKKGVNATVPVPPAMTRTDYVKEYALAYIRVNKLATAITQADITDTRPNTAVCGWVTGLITQVDTSTLFAQWQSAYEQFYEASNDIFDEWFQHLRDTASTAKLIGTYTSHHIATASTVSAIPIAIPEYNMELDILNVYINGLKLVRGINYTQTGNKAINLTLAVDVGTPIDFEVYKNAERII